MAEARTHYEKMRTENIEMAKCILDVGAYTRTVKAKILYNHMANAQLPQEYIAQFLKNHNYNAIINHHNYNPRVIETYIDKGFWKSTDSANFMSQFKHLLSHPFLVWEIAFEKLPTECKYALLILVTMGELVTLEDWKMAYMYFCINVNQEIKLSYDDITWNRVVKLLHDCFIRTQRKQEWIIVSTYNPSVRDFLITFIGQNTNIQRSLIQHSLFPEQLTYAFTESESNNYKLPDYFPRNYSSLDKNNIPYLVAKFNAFLIEKPKSCKIRKISNSFAKSSFDAAIFIKQFLICFPKLFRTLSTKIKSYLVELTTTGNYNNFSERICIVKAIDFTKDPTTLTSILTKLSEEEIPLDEYVPFIDLLNASNNTSIINDCFIENLEESIIEDIDTSINNEEECVQQKETYEEIAKRLPDGISLNRAFEHLEEIEASLPGEPEDDVEDYYWENRGIHEFETEDTQIDRMMQSLCN